MFVFLLTFYSSDPVKVNSLLERLSAMVPQKFSCSWSSLRSAEEISISETVTRNTDQSIANLEREVEVDTDTIGEQLSDLNAFLNSHFLRPQ